MIMVFHLVISWNARSVPSLEDVFQFLMQGYNQYWLDPLQE